MAGGSRPLTSFILQEFIEFADSWATRLSLFFVMTGSFIHILMSLGASGVTNLAVFNLVVFSLSIVCSIYALDTDPGLNTLLLLYAGIFVLSYGAGLISLIDGGKSVGPEAPLESMARRMEANGYSVTERATSGSSIPSYEVTKQGTTYELHCLHNERYDPSYFENVVDGSVIGEVRDNGYHCKITGGSAENLPVGLRTAITGEIEPRQKDVEDTDEPSTTN